jgi:hypothetical protein
VALKPGRSVGVGLPLLGVKREPDEAIDLVRRVDSLVRSTQYAARGERDLADDPSPGRIFADLRVESFSLHLIGLECLVAEQELIGYYQESRLIGPDSLDPNVHFDPV